jgi:hypothetical protein
MKTVDGKYEPALIANLNNRDPDHDELRADIEKLLRLPPTPGGKEISRAEYWLRTVLRKIEAFQFSHARRTMVPLSKYHGSRWQPRGQHNHLRVGKEWFIVADVPDITGTGAERKRQTIYWY